MPRIIAGTHRGMNLFTPPGNASRPTSDRAKEALFSMIGDDIEGMRVLDVFAGSGQISFEALSRGAQHATLIERDRDAIAAIKKNIAKTHFGDRVALMAGDCRRHVEVLKRRHERFDFIYVDPPWTSADVLASQIRRDIPALLTDDGLLVIESERKKPVLELGDVGLSLSKSCQYGLCVLSFYRFQTVFDAS